MSIESTKKDNVSIVKVQVDKLNAAVAPELKSALVLENKSGVKNLIIDISGVRYCDSSGLSALLVGNRLCKEASGFMILCGVQPTVMKIISIAHLDKVLHLTEKVEQAESKLKELTV